MSNYAQIIVTNIKKKQTNKLGIFRPEWNQTELAMTASGGFLIEPFTMAS